MPSKSSSRSASLKKSQSKASLASTNSSITSGEERRSKGSKAKRRERAEEREERERSTTDQSIEEIEVVAYDGPRPDEEFLQAMRIELQESHLSLRAQETIPYAYALQLSGKGLRLQKEEPVALERLVAVDVNQRSIHGYTSLHIASAAGNAEMVAFLLEMRADVSIASTYKSELPIHFAAQGGYDIVLRLLVEPTKAKGLLDVGTVTGWNALHLAVAGKHQNAMNLLIRAGANVNSRNEMLGGGTALHVASRMAWFEGMERLLERDANPNATDRLAQAPLHGAARRVDLRAVSLLLRSRANVHAIGPEGRKAVDFVPVEHPCREKVTLLLQAYARPPPKTIP